MKIHNSLTGKLEEFKPIEEGKIKMYVCGPTVYNYAHVGNMVPVIFFDTIYRYFLYKGYDVTYVSNFTDVDDKIIAAAKTDGISEKELSEKFIDIYLKDVEGFNCLPISKRPKVTENMDAMIDFIQQLIDKDYAYTVNGDVYFRVSKIKEYGKLSNRNIEELDSGSRVEINEQKENPNDFVLWKKTENGIKWDAPFGAGRPGWHTECVVLIDNIFRGEIDIHGGGVDLKFPHHENEIAQCTALWNRDLAKYWMHNGHLMVNGEKMSKSLNNFILAKDLREKYSANVIRLGIFKSHYRSPIDLTDALFEESLKTDEKVYNALKQAKAYLDINDIKYNLIKQDIELEKYMDEDFTTSNVITYLLDLVKELNLAIRNNENTNISQLYDRINLVNDILGLKYSLVDMNDEDKEIYNSWIKAREEKDFEKADEYRELLISKNII